MDDERTNRHFNRGATEFQNNEEGRIIKSSRKFGIEVEMFNEDPGAHAKLAKKLPGSFGLEHDGSIQCNGYPIEVVTPVLKGGAGEKAVVSMFKNINDLKYKTNKTCGLHVHLDGEGFKQGEVFACRVNDATPKLLSDLNESKGDYAFIVREEVMRRVTRNMEILDAIRIISDEYLSTGNDTLYLSKELREDIPEIRRSSARVDANKVDAVLDVYEFNTEYSMDQFMSGVEITAKIAAPGDYLCIVYGNNNLRNILTLLYLHTAYSDVFLAMLPKSRRQDNLYCQSIALALAPGEIENIRTYTELENHWYRTRNTYETRNRKRNNYDDSRYFTVNLHSLFAKYGTIEIRSHSGTLDHNKALYWTALHQEILDRIVSGNITIDRLRSGLNINDINDKVSTLKDILGIRSSLRTYMQKRIDYFKTNESK